MKNIEPINLVNIETLAELMDMNVHELMSSMQAKKIIRNYSETTDHCFELTPTAIEWGIGIQIMHPYKICGYTFDFLFDYHEAMDTYDVPFELPDDPNANPYAHVKEGKQQKRYCEN